RKNPAEQLFWIKINDHQSIELFPGSEVAADAPRLYHIAVETDDAEAMRLYLKSKGVAVPDKTAVGNIVEIVQYMPDGWTMKAQGKFMADTRVSTHMPHVGVMSAQLDTALKFYG